MTEEYIIEAWAIARFHQEEHFPFHLLSGPQRSGLIDLAKDEIAELQAAGFFITFEGEEVTAQ